MLALTVSNGEIGGYTAAGSFNTLILLFTYPIATALLPLFSRRVDDMILLRDAYGKTLKFSSLLVMPVAAFIIAFAHPLIVSFFGEAYDFGAPFLALIACVSLLVGVGSQAYSPLLNGVGRTREALLATGTGSVVAVATAYLLISRNYGVPGAIVGQIVGNIVSVTLGSLMARSRVGKGLGMFGAWRIYVAAGATAAVCYPLSLLVRQSEVTVAIGALAFLVLYVPALALVGALDKEDMGTLRGYFSFSPMLSRPLEIAIRYYDRVRSLWGSGHADAGAGGA